MIRKFVKKLIQNSGNSISREMKIRKNVRIKTSNGGQVIAGRGLLNDNVFLCAVGGG